MLLKLRQNTVFVSIHQLFGRILSRETETLIQLYPHLIAGKKLLFYLAFHLKNRFLWNQVITGNRYPDIVSPLRGRHLFHHDLFEQILYLLIQL